MWESVLASSKVEDFKAYIQQYPNGTFTAVAKKMIDSLQGQANANEAQIKNNDQRLENDALLKQAEAVKQKELERLEREKREKDKMLAATEEKLRLEAETRSNLEEELRKARQESNALKNTSSSRDQGEAAPKKIFISPVF